MTAPITFVNTDALMCMETDHLNFQNLKYINKSVDVGVKKIWLENKTFTKPLKWSVHRKRIQVNWTSRVRVMAV